MHAPPVVSEHVEDGEHDDEEGSSPFGFETDSHEDTGSETEDGNEDTGEAPLALEDKSNEKEDEEHTSRKLEAVSARVRLSAMTKWGEVTHYLRLSLSLMVGNPANVAFLLVIESEKTMRRPPTTERLRRKKLRSKMRP